MGQQVRINEYEPDRNRRFYRGSVESCGTATAKTNPIFKAYVVNLKSSTLPLLLETVEQQPAFITVLPLWDDTEPVPVIRTCQRVPSPVRWLKVAKDDPSFPVFLSSIAPNIEIAPSTSLCGAARALEPGMLIGGVIDHQFSYDSQVALMGLRQKAPKVTQCAVDRVDRAIIGDIVTVVPQRTGIKRQ